MVKHPLSLQSIALFAFLALSVGSSMARESKQKPLKPIQIPLKVYFDGTERQWYGPVQVGTPPQTLNVIFDASTSGSDIQILSKQCGNCTKQQDKFHYKRSATFSGPDGDGQSYIVYSQLSVHPNETTWEYQVVSGSDKITLGDVSVKDLNFGLAINETEPFQKVPWSGIVGLQPASSSDRGLFRTLIDRGLPAIAGYDLAPRSAGNAQLTLGGVDHTRYRGDFQIIQSTVPNGFAMQSNFIAVNGRTTPALSSGVVILPSTVTPTWILDFNTTDAIYSLISPDIKPYPPKDDYDIGRTYGIPCSQIPHLKASIDLSFTSSTTGKLLNLTIPTSELSIGPFASNTKMCQTFIVAYNFAEAQGFLGGSLLKHYYVKFDYSDSVNLERTIGFAERV